MQQKMRRIDFVGNGILMASTVGVLFALSYAGSSYSWSSWRTLVPLILGLLGYAIFAAWESWGFSPQPVMPMRLFANRTSAVVVVNTFINSALVFWVVFFVPIYFLAVLLFSPTRAGVGLLPQSLVGIPGAAISAIALSRWKYRPLHFIGFALFTIGLGLLSIMDETSPTGMWVGFQCICALGGGMILNTLLPAFQAPVPEKDQAAATAAWCFVRTFGSVWGIAIPAVIFNNRVESLLHHVSDPAARDLLRRGGAYQHASADFIQSFAEPVQSEIRGVYRDAVSLCFAVGGSIRGPGRIAGSTRKGDPTEN